MCWSKVKSFIRNYLSHYINLMACTGRQFKTSIICYFVLGVNPKICFILLQLILKHGEKNNWTWKAKKRWQWVKTMASAPGALLWFAWACATTFRENGFPFSLLFKYLCSNFYSSRYHDRLTVLPPLLSDCDGAGKLNKFFSPHPSCALWRNFRSSRSVIR